MVAEIAPDEQLLTSSEQPQGTDVEDISQGLKSSHTPETPRSKDAAGRLPKGSDPGIQGGGLPVPHDINRGSKWVVLRMMAGTCGGLQTVPRAELTAMKVVLEHKDDGFPIVTDHKNIVDKISSIVIGITSNPHIYLIC